MATRVRTPEAWALIPIPAFSPKPQRGKILDTIIEPVVRATGFTGFLYAGLMMTPDGPSVLEFNVRLGDPETQPLMMRLDKRLGRSADGRGEEARSSMDRLDWSPEPATCVVMASGGYPGAFQTGREDHRNRIGDRTRSCSRRERNATGDDLVTAGGRVLGVTASGADLQASIDAAYAAVDKIHFAGMHYRKDIGYRGLQRYNSVGSGP